MAGGQVQTAISLRGGSVKRPAREASPVSIQNSVGAVLFPLLENVRKRRNPTLHGGSPAPRYRSSSLSLPACLESGADEGLENVALAVEGAVVPGDSDGEVLAREVPELGVAAEPVAAVADHGVPVERVPGEAEAVALPEAATVEAAHGPQRLRGEDVPAEEL